MANVPALPDANAWGLLKLKSGSKSQQAKQLQRLQNEASPLEAPDNLRDEKKVRRLQFNINRERLNLWKGPVHQNRLADQLIFPLQSRRIQFSNSDEAKEAKFMKDVEVVKQDMESLQGKLFSALYKTTSQPKSAVDKERDEQLQLARKMSAKASDQIKRRLREVALLQKTKLQKRIKSKNYHRRAKRRNIKEFEKDIVLLRTNNPAAFAERLIEADRLRAKERASLRHKTGGKFAKLQRLRAKYDTEAREAVAHMQDNARDLTRRRRDGDDDDGDSDAALSEAELSSSDEEDDEDAASGLDEEEMTRREEEGVAPHLVDWWAKVENQPLKTAPTVAADEEMPVQQPATTLLSTLAPDDILQRTEAANKPDHHPGSLSLDPTSDTFFAALQEAVGEEEVGIAEAEFEAEKMAVEDAEAPQDLDPFLPGWNRWTGPGMEAADEALRKKRLIRAPKRKRKDKGRAKVIIRERVNDDLKKHLVKRIPFPYATPEQFEQVIDQPVSREWTTEASHKELTKPKVILKSGRVIQPINKDIALLREKDTLRLATGRRRV